MHEAKQRDVIAAGQAFILGRGRLQLMAVDIQVERPQPVHLHSAFGARCLRQTLRTVLHALRADFNNHVLASVVAYTALPSHLSLL